MKSAIIKRTWEYEFKKRLFIAKRWLANRQEHSFMRTLSRNEQLSQDALRELNWKTRQELVLYCFNHIQFYRRKYSECGFEPGDIALPENFERLPIIEKEEIRACETEIINRNYQLKDMPIYTTGGSTGCPLKTYGDPNIPLVPMSWRTLNWWGIGICDNSGYLYRAVPEGWRKIYQKTLLWPTKRNWLSASQMTEENMMAFYLSLVRDKAKYLVGYVGAIDIFASFLEQKGYHLNELCMIWTTSAPLPKIKRAFLEKIFECEVYTQYGSCEFYWIAAECKQKCGLHIASDIRHVEVVKGNNVVGDNEYGDLIVTDLVNKAFPLIRYRLGDRGRLIRKPCSCGLPFPLMDYVQGRITDNIKLHNGTTIPGEFWTTIFDDFTDKIKSFQVFQDNKYTITVKYEPHKGVDYSTAIAIVRDRLHEKIGKDEILYIAEGKINVNDNGKTRFVISEVGK